MFNAKGQTYTSSNDISISGNWPILGGTVELCARAWHSAAGCLDVAVMSVVGMNVVDGDECCGERGWMCSTGGDGMDGVERKSLDDEEETDQS